MAGSKPHWPALDEEDALSTVTEVAGLNSYAEAFSDVQQRTSRQPKWLQSLRQRAFEHFIDTGFPTTKDEAWRFTNLAPISRESFRVPGSGPIDPAFDDLGPFLLPAVCCRLVFVNGRFASQLSDWLKLPAGVQAGSLADQIAGNGRILEPRLGRYLDVEADPFCALNSAFLEDGAYLHIARKAEVAAPIHLLFLYAGGNTPAMVHPRNLIIAEPHAHADILEEHISLDDGTFFINSATELVAAENSKVAHHMIERVNRGSFHIANLRAEQERNASASLHSVLLGGGLVRNNIHPVMSGEAGECLINGLFIGDGKQHLDNYMLVEHAAPHCASHQFYNGILGGSAHGVFHGRIIVHKVAQKTDAKQTNRNLLLSDNAQIDTKPQLEIYADDVKCTHGATIGQIDEQALYYLRSRGIDESSARELLLLAFAGECLGRIQSATIREHIERFVHESLPEAAQESLTGSGPERHWEEIG